MVSSSSYYRIVLAASCDLRCPLACLRLASLLVACACSLVFNLPGTTVLLYVRYYGPGGGRVFFSTLQYGIGIHSYGTFTSRTRLLRHHKKIFSFFFLLFSSLTLFMRCFNINHNIITNHQSSITNQSIYPAITIK